MSVPPLEFYRWICQEILSTNFLYWKQHTGVKLHSKPAVLFGLVSACVTFSTDQQQLFARKNSLCVYAHRSECSIFMDLLGTLRRAELISYLFEVCLNLQSVQANNNKKKYQSVAEVQACVLYMNGAVM